MDGEKLLKALMSETACKDEECVVCELLTRVRGTPYESVVARIKELAFKPKGPRELDALLDNFLLIHLGLQIEAAHPECHFGGVLTYDFMIPPYTTVYASPKEVASGSKKWKKLMLVLNVDHRMGMGIHWVSLVVDVPAGEIQYNDSYGNPPLSGQIQSSRPYPRITDSQGRFVSLLGEWIREVQVAFVREGTPMRFVYNRTRHQEKQDHSNCGVYAMMALNASAEGISFEKQNARPIPMEVVTAAREKMYKRSAGYKASLPSIALAEGK